MRPEVADLLKGSQRRVGGINPIEAMQVAFSKAAIQANWDTICKALLVCNISDLDPSKGLRALLVNKSETEVS